MVRSPASFYNARMNAVSKSGPHITFTPEELVVTWVKGGQSRYAAIWLRDNSLAPDHRDPRNGQKLIDISLLPDAITLRGARLEGEGVDLVFAPDGHAAHFSLDWLHQHCSVLRHHQRQTSQAKTWAAERQGTLVQGAFPELVQNPQELLAWLRAVRDDGVALMTALPVEPGRIFDAVALFGYVRETNYGRLFDVISKPDPNNLAYSNLGLGVHTDNPYRDPVPMLQLLHCLQNAAEGGENAVRDGFHAAAQLRAEAPEDFALLTRHEVPFAFSDCDSHLTTRARLIEVNSEGQVTAVRYNSRSVAPFDLPADIMAPFYRAYRRFGRLLLDARQQVTFKLAAGELFIVDNRRVLHGRTAFSSAGRRHLQGCYADKDSLLSKIAVLERE